MNEHELRSQDKPIELKLGMRVIYDGKEYVLNLFRMTSDKSGRSLDIQAKDPFLNMFMELEERKKKEMMEEAIKQMKKLNSI